MLRRVSALVGAALCSGACTFRMGDFSLVSSKNVGLTPEVTRRSVEGRDCVHFVLFIPLGSLVPNVEEAMDRATANFPDANVMTDIAVYNDLLFTYIYNRICVRVNGDVGLLR